MLGRSAMAGLPITRGPEPLAGSSGLDGLLKLQASMQNNSRIPKKSHPSCRRFSEDDWEVMRSRVRRLGRSGTAGSPASAGPGPLAGSREPEPGRHMGSESARQGLVDDHSSTKCAAPQPLNRSVTEQASGESRSLPCHQLTACVQVCPWQ